MHVGKLMARLNPKNVRFDVGAGGIPELTSTDVAAALGMVPEGLGRELLCLAWWPDSAIHSRPRAVALLHSLMMEEWSRREETAVLDAVLAIATSTGGESLRRAQRMYAEAHAARWPHLTQVTNEIHSPAAVYAKLPGAVIHEVIAPKTCPVCEGRGEVRQRASLAQCARCDGRGVVPIGNTQRGEMLGVTEGAYRKTWDKPYTWLLERCMTAMQDSARKMESAAA